MDKELMNFFNSYDFFVKCLMINGYDNKYQIIVDKKIMSDNTRVNISITSNLSDSEIMAKVDDKYSWDKNLMVAYENLSEEEKQKDRNHVIEAVKINKEISRGDIKLDYLEKKYYKEAKSI